MSSDLIVPVVEVKNVRIHPNADMLSICEVLGYQMVSGLVEDPEGPIERYFRRGVLDEKGRRIPWDQNDDCEREEDYELVRFNFPYKDGDLVVYFPADTILPQKWAEEFDVTHLLQGKEANRVGRCRLRGEPSFGLIVPPPEDVIWELGQNVADYYDAKKYEPPPTETAPDAAPRDAEIDPFFVTYTNVQNGLLLYEKFEEGEEVVATEKIHGRNVRVGIVNGSFVLGSRTYRKRDPFAGDPRIEVDGDLSIYKDTLYWSVLPDTNVLKLLYDLQAHGAQTVIVFGEIYGQGVQSLHYGCTKKKGFRAFDIYVNGDYLDYDTFLAWCKQVDVEVAPALYRGPFDLDKIKEISNGKSVLPGAKNIREGVVVRTVKERRDSAWGRMVMKFVSPEYDLSKHKKKDTTDV